MVGRVERRAESYVGKRGRNLEIMGKTKLGRPKLKQKDIVTEDLREKGWRIRKFRMGKVGEGATL